MLGEGNEGGWWLRRLRWSGSVGIRKPCSGQYSFTFMFLCLYCVLHKKLLISFFIKCFGKPQWTSGLLTSHSVIGDLHKIGEKKGLQCVNTAEGCCYFLWAELWSCPLSSLSPVDSGTALFSADGSCLPEPGVVYNCRWHWRVRVEKFGCLLRAHFHCPAKLLLVYLHVMGFFPQLFK